MKKGGREIPWASSSWLVFVSWKTSAPEITGKEWESYPSGSRSSPRKNGKAEEWKDSEERSKRKIQMHIIKLEVEQVNKLSTRKEKVES